MHLNSLLLISAGWTQGLQLFAGLSILIALHEAGHFFFARLFKTRVEKFYLFFDFLFPFSNLLNFSLYKKKKGDTEYGIGWFPLGGYVKISGMIDESMDKEAMALPPQPWEFRSKKAYERLFIMLGGIIVNVVLAIVLYIFIFGIYGEQYLLTENTTYGIAVDSVAKSIGLRNGDMVKSVNGEEVQRFDRIVPYMILHNAKAMQVMRNGQLVNIDIKEGTIHNILTRDKENFMNPRFPLLVGAVAKNGTAEKMSMKPGDSVVAINGMPVRFSDEFDSIKHALTDNNITVTVIRGNMPVEMKGVLPADKTFGIRWDAEKYFKLEHKRYNPIEAIGKGFSHTYEQFSNYLLQFKLIFASKEVKPSESLGGIISFGKIFPGVFDMEQFLRLVAFISIILAFMNLLPIPGLDGGYVMFLLFEMVTGKKVSEKVMERATTVGLILLVALMVYANGLDIFRLFKH